MTNLLNAFVDAIMDLIYRLMYGVEIALLSILGYIERFFDLFAGTKRVTYGEQNTYLINILLENSAISNAFWAMALLAIALSFFFAIIAIARKTVDFSDHVKQSNGQIMSNFFRGLLIILVLNFGVVASINLTNVLLDRINYAMVMAPYADGNDLEKEFTDKEYAQMAAVLATIANFSTGPSADMRFNANACFNAVRSDLLGLTVSGVFNYNYPVDENGNYCWQGALQLLANAADLNTELTLSDYNGEVINALTIIKKQMAYNKTFYPVERVEKDVVDGSDMRLDRVIFLITSFGAERNTSYSNGSLDDPLRQSYLREQNPKDYTSLNQVTKDFSLSKIHFLMAYIAGIVMIYVMVMVIFTFVVRMFNIGLLYITSPFFASSVSLDDGEKFKAWIQSFIIQLFSGFGSVIAMRLYLLFIPIICSSKMRFFLGNSTLEQTSDLMAKLIAVMAGGWAVLGAGSMITGVLSGSPGMAAAQQEGAMRAMTMAGVAAAPGMALGAAKSVASGAYKGVRAAAHPVDTVRNALQSVSASWKQPNRQWRDTVSSEKQRVMNNANTDAQYQKWKEDGGKSDGSGATFARNSDPSRDARPAPQAEKAPEREKVDGGAFYGLQQSRANAREGPADISRPDNKMHFNKEAATAAAESAKKDTPPPQRVRDWRGSMDTIQESDDE